MDLVGGSAASSTRVFGCFFLGLALGAAVAPGLVRRVRRPWRALALAEAAVGLLALAGIYLPEWTGWIWPTLGTGRLLGWEGPAIKLGLSVAVVLPSAFFMGLVLPLLARAVLRDEIRFSRHGVWIYAVNTLGGVLGLTSVALLSLHLFGAGGSMALAAGINVLVAIGCLVLDFLSGPIDSRSPLSREERGERGGVSWAALGASFVSGAGVLAFEVLAFQLVGLVAPLSFYRPMGVLTAVILVLGIAAWAVPRVAGWVGGSWKLVFLALCATSLGMVVTPLLFFRCARWMDPGTEGTFYGFLAQLVVMALVSLGPALFVAGLVFPSVLAWHGEEGGDRYGRRWGWLLASNGVGGLLGAELAYQAVLPAMGVHRGMGGVGIFYGIAALVWALSRRPRSFGLLGCSVAAAGLAGLALVPLGALPHLNPQGVVILDERTGREGTVAVVDSREMGRRIIVSNHYVLGGTRLRYDAARLAHLPLLLHAAPRRVAFIGLGTGITPGAALEHRRVQAVVAVELSPLVVRAADRYFGPFNHNITRSPRARVVVEDGRIFLAASPRRFDVVVGDLFLPWSPGVGRLYSIEHFRGVRDALQPGGVFCQWLPMYQLTMDQFDMIQATFRQVFPSVYLFRNTFDCRYPALGLIAFRNGDLDWSVVRARCDEVRRNNDVLDPLVRHVEGVAMLYLGPLAPPGGTSAAVNTLSNMRLELAAGRERVSGKPGEKYIYGETWLRFAYDWGLRHLGTDGQPDRRLTELAWMGQRLSFWEAVRRYRGPLSPEDLADIPVVRKEIVEGFPKPIRGDDRADWRQWPGDAKLVRPRLGQDALR
ncbi:MAG TPA: spermidine synthase [Planctomycetes bacterium]|nr:spermidine synthase [Planctomycetota bacterium]